MSVLIVSDDCIDRVVYMMLGGCFGMRVGACNAASGTLLGRRLLRLNVATFRARYGDDIDEAAILENYKFTVPEVSSVIACCKSAACWVYNSDHDTGADLFKRVRRVQSVAARLVSLVAFTDDERRARLESGAGLSGVTEYDLAPWDE